MHSSGLLQVRETYGKTSVGFSAGPARRGSETVRAAITRPPIIIDSEHDHALCGAIQREHIAQQHREKPVMRLVNSPCTRWMSGFGLACGLVGRRRAFALLLDALALDLQELVDTDHHAGAQHGQSLQVRGLGQRADRILWYPVSFPRTPSRSIPSAAPSPCRPAWRRRLGAHRAWRFGLLRRSISIEQLHRHHRHDGRDRALVDKLRMAVAAQHD